MRKVTAGLFHSVYGVVEAPNLWQGDSFDDDLGQMLGEIMGRTDTVILGRLGYQEWSGYWPTATADQGFGEFINHVPKHVASRTRTGPLEWSNASLIDGNVDAFVAELKKREGGEIAAMAGITIVRHLLYAGLLDELTLITHPVIAGTGRHLFEASDPVTPLALVRTERTTKGNVVSTYSRR